MVEGCHKCVESWSCFRLWLMFSVSLKVTGICYLNIDFIAVAGFTEIVSFILHMSHLDSICSDLFFSFVFIPMSYLNCTNREKDVSLKACTLTLNNGIKLIHFFFNAWLHERMGLLFKMTNMFKCAHKGERRLDTKQIARALISYKFFVIFQLKSL